MRRLPPLNALRAFEAAARCEGFSEAAEQLHVTPSAVSHQIRTLEADLGVELFRRRPRQVRLTEAGRAFLPPVRDALEQVASAADTLRRGVRSPALIVSSEPPFAISWLVPRLAEFYAAHPEIEVRLDTSVDLVDFRDSDVDLCIRYTPYSEFDGLMVYPLFNEEIVPVCSPSLAGTDGRGLQRPSDLTRLRLLHSLSRPGQWQNWLNAAGVGDIALEKGQWFSNDAPALEAAANGLGVALANRTLVERQLVEGRLVAPFETGYCNDYGYYLVYPPAAQSDQRVIAFRDWLLGVIEEEIPAELIASRP